MKFKPVLFASIAVAALGAATVLDAEGSLPFSPQVVHASSSDIVGIKNHDVKIKLKQHPTLEKLDITATIDSLPRNFSGGRTVYGYFKNVQNGRTFSFILPFMHFKPYELSVTREFYWNGGWSIDDGDYWIVYDDVLQDPIDGSARYEHRYYGQSEVVTFKDHKIISIGGRGQNVDQPQKSQTKTPATNSSSASGKNGWSGKSYYQNGNKVYSKWIYDNQYKSYFYIDAAGNYVQNAWVGNYYLTSGGYMAQNEWVYDKNYGAYYYLTGEGSYARNTWVANYYIKSNGKMAKSEWVYDKNYGSYYYLTGEGSYARNSWVGNYYLKSNGKMAKNEWIYDRNYRAYYYLTGEGSYARNAWIGDYYLKSNGKMAVSERTPDGYRVDGSGKWIR